MSSNQGQGERFSRMSDHDKEVIFLVDQFLREEGLHASAHSLERDTKMYFDLKYFEEVIIAGQWAEADWYLRGYFSDIQENKYGLKMIFEIYKQKYFEALYWLEMDEAHEILQTELKSILSGNQNIYKELAGLLLLNDFREHPSITDWENSEKARASLHARMRSLVLNCPDLKDKLKIPTIPSSRLISLMIQSFKWQHDLCERKLPDPVLTTLFEDHDCLENMPPHISTNASRMLVPSQNFGPFPASTNLPMGSIPGPRSIDVRGLCNVGESSRRARDCLDSESTDSLVTAKRFCASELSTFVEQSARQTLPESSNNATLRSHAMEEMLSGDPVLMGISNLSVNGDAASRTQTQMHTSRQRGKHTKKRDTRRGSMKKRSIN